jgi:choline dehydrogenase-like flavoprotein
MYAYSDSGVEEIEIPFLAPNLTSNSSVLWPYETTPQTGLVGRQMAYPRGKVLGGTTSISKLCIRI